MKNLIQQLQEKNKNNWLVNFDRSKLAKLEDQTLTFYQKFIQLKQKNKQVKILIFTSDILTFIASFLAGIETSCQIFLGNNQWQEREWQQVFNLVKPDVIIGDLKQYEYLLEQTTDKPVNLELEKALIMIPTGGTSGIIKFTIHTLETLTNSVKSFAQYFQVQSINACCLLPLYHVSGLMQLMRSFLTNGKLNFLNYADLKQGNFPELNTQDYFISLVPTQLQYLLEINPQWLTNFQTILLGGAKPWASLLNLARTYHLKLALVYGMTETASHIVALKTEDFLRGNESNGKVLNHSQIMIKNEQGQRLTHLETGIINIKSSSLYLGYYPDLFEPNQCFETDDLGYFDQEGYLYIVGRNSQKIITGGENVNPTEIEEVILATKLVKEVCIFGLPDEKWGEVVTAIYVPIDPQIDEKIIKDLIKEKLASFKIPKLWFNVEQIPRNLQGKINDQELKKIYQSMFYARERDS